MSVISEQPPYGGCYGIKGRREAQEDATCFAGLPGSGVEFFGLFDGHGGAEVSAIVSKNLPTIVFKELARVSNLQDKGQVTVAITRAYYKMQLLLMDASLKNGGKFERQGTTALCLIKIVDVRNPHRGMTLYCANVGDSKGVICFQKMSDQGGGEIVVSDVSVEHKPKNPIELERILKCGGFVNLDGGTPRVWSDETKKCIGLSTSRALGDLESRFVGSGETKRVLPKGQFLVSPLPDVTVTHMDKVDHGFCILACDGVWDVLSSQDVCSIVIGCATEELAQKGKPKKGALSKKAVRAVVSEAYKKGSGDNITCYLIPF